MHEVIKDKPGSFSWVWESQTPWLKFDFDVLDSLDELSILQKLYDDEMVRHWIKNVLEEEVTQNKALVHILRLRSDEK